MVKLLENIKNRIEIARQRRAMWVEHELILSDPGLRNDHYAARDRASAEGLGDCPYCLAY